MTDEAEMAAIEREAFLAWPAAEVEACGGWRLRATQGVTRRANSVWLGDGCRLPVDESVTRVEAFYRARGLPPMFQVSPAPGHVALDAALEGRGYRTATPVSVQVAEAATVAARPVGTPAGGAAAALSVELASALSADWFDVSANHGRYREVPLIYRALLDRLDGRATFALGRCDGRPSAVGLLVRGAAAAGIFAMQTLPEARRRGLGRTLLRAMATEAASAGTRLLYLQVEQGNAEAERLYAACGFRERYAYHYRIGPTAEPSAH